MRKMFPTKRTNAVNPLLKNDKILYLFGHVQERPNDSIGIALYCAEKMTCNTRQIIRRALQSDLASVKENCSTYHFDGSALGP